MSERAMPHQLAVRSGVIHPKYPAAPRQWVTYMGDQPEGGGSIPTPNLSSGVQRNFSRRWGGDAESKFPLLDKLGRAATIGAIGALLSKSINQPVSPPTGRPPSPYGMRGPGGGQNQGSPAPTTPTVPGSPGSQISPATGRQRSYARTMPSATADLGSSTGSSMFGTEREVPDTAGAIGGMKALGGGDNFIDVDSWESPKAVGGMKAIGPGDDFIDAESWETSGALGAPKMSFASPALMAVSGTGKKTQRRSGLNPEAARRIRRDLSKATRNL